MITLPSDLSYNGKFIHHGYINVYNKPLFYEYLDVFPPAILLKTAIVLYCDVEFIDCYESWG